MSSDAELLAEIARGSEGAMAELYDRHANSVYRFALKTLRNPTDAAEVLNEVMLEVWRKADTYGGRSKVTTWLLGITHHKSVDRVRRNSRHQAEALDEHTLEAQGSCDLELAAVGAEQRELVTRCLEELGDGQRQVVYLTFFEGLAYPDIAGILGIPSGTVKTRMLHAKQKLLACLSRLMAV